MQGRRLTSMGLLISIFITTFSFSQNTLKIQNITDGLDTCSDSNFTEKTACEAHTPIWDNYDFTWDPNAGTNGECSSFPSQLKNQIDCEEAGLCSDASYTTKKDCEGGPYWSTGTLDIYMKNEAGCSYCVDPSGFSTRLACESLGNGGDGSIWKFDATKSEAECTTANGDYFDGNVSGFQIILTGVDIGSNAEAASGGTAGLNPVVK